MKRINALFVLPLIIGACCTDNTRICSGTKPFVEFPEGTIMHLQTYRSIDATQNPYFISDVEFTTNISVVLDVRQPVTNEYGVNVYIDNHRQGTVVWQGKVLGIFDQRLIGSTVDSICQTTVNQYNVRIGFGTGPFYTEQNGFIAARGNLSNHEQFYIRVELCMVSNPYKCISTSTVIGEINIRN